MNDWKAISAARSLALTDAELDRISTVLTELEAAFRPLVAAIPHEIEPATVLSESAVKAL